MLTKAYIPFRGYYSTPFVRWQGSLANEHSIVLGANTSRRFFESKRWDPKMVEYVLVGSTVYQKQWFYSGPWAAGMMGAAGVPGVLIAQACSTSTFTVYQAGMGVETGLFGNGWWPPRRPLFQRPARHLAQPERSWRPDDRGLGHGQLRGTPRRGRDDQDGRERGQAVGVTRAECDAFALRRHEQYKDGMANDRDFQKQYMFPVEVQVTKKKTVTV